MAAGLLSGKHRRYRPVAPSSREANGWSEPPIRDQERLWRIVDELVAIGDEQSVEAAQIAPAWLLTRPAVSSLVLGGRTREQFERNFRAVTLKPTQEQLSRLDAVSAPPLIYPHWHRAQFAASRFSPADRVLSGEAR